MNRDCIDTPPPAGPVPETDEAFQARVDRLLADATPWWVDAMFWTFVMGLWAFGIAGALWLASL